MYCIYNVLKYIHIFGLLVDLSIYICIYPDIVQVMPWIWTKNKNINSFSPTIMTDLCEIFLLHTFKTTSKNVIWFASTVKPIWETSREGNSITYIFVYHFFSFFPFPFFFSRMPSFFFLVCLKNLLWESL